MSVKTPIDELIALMARLRTPGEGCPWDLEQSFRTIAPYTIEEAFEVADAIERGDLGDLKGELGDLLFQVVFHARMAEEAGAFAFDDVARAVVAKMRDRHPHVFGDAGPRDAEGQTVEWEKQKAKERAARGAAGVLDDVPAGLPGLVRAVKLQNRASRVGFDWNDPHAVLDKIREETGELVEAMDSSNADRVEDEFGDLLFVMANLARHLKIDPESALRRSNEKFIRRFTHIERSLAARGVEPGAASLSDMEDLWNEAKAIEKSSG